MNQLIGKKSGSAGDTVNGDASSGVVLGTVTGGAQNELEKARGNHPPHEPDWFAPGRIAGFHLGARGQQVSAYLRIT
jgi:hypothetical protein